MPSFPGTGFVHYKLEEKNKSTQINDDRRDQIGDLRRIHAHVDLGTAKRNVLNKEG